MLPSKNGKPEHISQSSFQLTHLRMSTMDTPTCFFTSTRTEKKPFIAWCHTFIRRRCECHHTYWNIANQFNCYSTAGFKSTAPIADLELELLDIIDVDGDDIDGWWGSSTFRSSVFPLPFIWYPTYVIWHCAKGLLAVFSTKMVKNNHSFNWCYWNFK